METSQEQKLREQQHRHRDHRPRRSSSSSAAAASNAPASASSSSRRRTRPNIVLILTDQERSHRHWPAGWAESNLQTHYDRLIGCRPSSAKRSGPRSSVVFHNAFTATTECSPSRASILTSTYPSEHGVTTTPGALDPRTDRGIDLGIEAAVGGRPNLLRILSSPTPYRGGDGGNNNDGDDGNNDEDSMYDVAWKGKWHLNPPLPPRFDERSFLKLYGATSPWNPPEAGHSLCRVSTLGGGRLYGNDERFLRGPRRDTKKKKEEGPGGDDNRRRGSGSGSGSGNQHPKSRRRKQKLRRTRSTSSSSDEEEESDEESIFDFLAKHKNRDDDDDGGDETAQPKQRPFFLAASLVNPHDIWASGHYAGLTDQEFFQETGYHPDDFRDLPVPLPPNRDDDLFTKPTIQSFLSGHRAFGDLSDEPRVGDRSDDNGEGDSDARRYVRFYAHLHAVVDREIGSLLDALEDTGRMDETIIVRTSDHGEMALSHGMREKRMQCYDETMGVPLVINYPAGWFDDDDCGGNADDGCDGRTGDSGDEHQNGSDGGRKGDGGENPTPSKAAAAASSTRTCRTMVSSIDLLPTIVELAGRGVVLGRGNGDDEGKGGRPKNDFDSPYRGKSLVPFLTEDIHGNDGRSDERDDDDNNDEILFAFDEPLAPPNVPGYIRCIRTRTFKYAVYFDDGGCNFQYESYDLIADPYEMNNLAGPGVEPDDVWWERHGRLNDLVKRMGAAPGEFDWEKMSVPRRWDHPASIA